MYSLRYGDPITWEQVEGVYAGCLGVAISHHTPTQHLHAPQQTQQHKITLYMPAL